MKKIHIMMTMMTRKRALNLMTAIIKKIIFLFLFFIQRRTIMIEANEELKIYELRKNISLLKWDLDILKNKEVKARKELQLKLYEDELNQILTQSKIKKKLSHTAS